MHKTGSPLVNHTQKDLPCAGVALVLPVFVLFVMRAVIRGVRLELLSYERDTLLYVMVGK